LPSAACTASRESGSAVNDGHDWPAAPQMERMRFSCASSDAPPPRMNSEGMLKRGCKKSISATTHPALHMSTAGPYVVAPSSSSGGRYHSVMTRCVRGRREAEAAP